MQQLRLDLPKEARKALLRGGSWSGSARLTIEPSSGRRGGKDLIRLKMIAEEADSQCVLSDDAQCLVSTWNDRCEPYRVTKRNQPVKDTATCSRMIKQAVDKIGLPDLLSALEGYFDCCDRGGHTAGGIKNRAYKSLDGFLRKQVQLAERGELPWWEQNNTGPAKSDEPVGDDPHPELTMRVADAFAKRFLKRQQFGKLKQTDTAYRKFQIAGDWILKTAKKNPYGLSIDRVLVMLLDCIAEGYSGGSVSPGNLAADHTWRVLFPQRMSSIYSA